MAAENQDGQEKTEEPTPKRLEESKKKGQVPRSKELNTTVILLAASLGLLFFANHIGSGIRRLFEEGLLFDRRAAFDTTMMTQIVGRTLYDAFVLFMPWILVVLLAVFVTPLMLGGFSFSTEAMKPKLSKLDPIKGMKKLASVNGLMELLKSIAKILVIGGGSTYLIIHWFGDLMRLGELGFEGAFARSLEIVGWFVILVCASMSIIALVDAPFQLWSHRRKLRMTKQEVKEERKNTEGNPEVKGQIRRVQQEMAMRRMMGEVPKADVVVTNPTHYAVALRYDEDTMRAPKVVAKGSDLIAGRIRELAADSGVPLLSAPVLARAIYFSTELDDEIPAGLYVAVAQVLAYVHQIKLAEEYHYARPQPPGDFDIPEEFRRRAR